MVSPLNFEDKKKMLFDCLTSAEQCIKGTSLEQKKTVLNESHSRRDRKDVGRRFHGKESIFKKPGLPIGKCLQPRRVPDFKMNPHKWKRYSLGDTDISDRTNTSAAFAFLAEIEKRKESAQDQDDEMNDDTDKIVFNSKRPRFQQSVSLRTKSDVDNSSCDLDQKSTMRGSKTLMPEYVIGQKLQSKKRKPSTMSSSRGGKSGKETKRSQPKLQHLFDGEDEED